MPSGVIFMQWESYRSPDGASVFFRHDPLTFNSRQDRLHELSPGDRLWLVSRCPHDQQYYFIATLAIRDLKRNEADSPEAQFGQYSVIADRAKSYDFGTRFPADGLLRALEFESGKPIKYGASIGQSLQTLRFLTDNDERVLIRQSERLMACTDQTPDAPFGLWTKCDRIFAEYFLKNWMARHEPLAFLLYDPPPALRSGAPIFIHSDKNLRLIANFRRGEFVAGHKWTAAPEERIAERERIWMTYRASTVDPPAKADFDAFWNKQAGVRGLFIMEDVAAVAEPIQFKTYARALEWGYPTGVGYRYLSFSQSWLLGRIAGLAGSP
jgi:hypothetical protein